MPEPMIERLSQRITDVDAAEGRSVAERKEAARLAGDPGWELLPDHLSAVERDKLGATSRRQKRDDLTLADCREYWDSRYTPEEGDAIDRTSSSGRCGG